MNTLTFTLNGDVNIQIIVSELDDGTLQFDLSVLDDTGSIGDLNAIFFDLSDDIPAAGLIATGDDVTGVKFKEEGVTKVDNFTNINGEVVNEYGKFDAGVQFGTSGIAQDDIRETSFVLSHDDVDLTIASVLGQDFAARLTSVGEEGGSREDSSKIAGEAPTEPDVDPEPVNVAIDDVLRVGEDETFNEEGMRDIMDGGVLSVLQNDELDTFWFESEIVSANGDPASINEIVEGSNGGLMILYADGTIDFSANEDFEYLNDRETATTEFTYGIEGGDTATVTVIVSGEDDILG